MKAYFHLPGLFEYYELYKRFLSLFFSHKEYFYDYVEIGSIYGCNDDCIWNGGRTNIECDTSIDKVIELINKYNLSARLTLSNLLIEDKHLNAEDSNELVNKFNNTNNGIIIGSDLLLNYLKNNYKNYYYVSSTTKVIRDYDKVIKELNNDDYKYVVLDFRLNHDYAFLNSLTSKQRNKIELLCNECCDINCADRRKCYENVSALNLGLNVAEHRCTGKNGSQGYKFSSAKNNPSFISNEDIINTYLPIGINQFKIEGRGLGSAIVLEFLLYYLVKPEYELKVREEIYLDSMLDLF